MSRSDVKRVDVDVECLFRLRRSPKKCKAQQPHTVSHQPHLFDA